MTITCDVHPYHSQSSPAIEGSSQPFHSAVLILLPATIAPADAPKYKPPVVQQEKQEQEQEQQEQQQQEQEQKDEGKIRTKMGKKRTREKKKKNERDEGGQD